ERRSIGSVAFTPRLRKYQDNRRSHLGRHTSTRSNIGLARRPVHRPSHSISCWHFGSGRGKERGSGSTGPYFRSGCPKATIPASIRDGFTSRKRGHPMNRRAKGEGSCRERPDGRFEARFTVDGRARSFFGATQREALKKMRDAQRRIDADLPIPSESLTVGGYLAQWLAGRKAEMTPESWRRYKGRADRLLPLIGRVKLSKLQPGQLREAYASIGKEVSGTTVQLCHGVLSTALRDAEREGLVARNVASLVSAPRRDTTERPSLSPDDARAL